MYCTQKKLDIEGLTLKVILLAGVSTLIKYSYIMLRISFRHQDKSQPVPNPCPTQCSLHHVLP